MNIQGGEKRREKEIKNEIDRYDPGKANRREEAEKHVREWGGEKERVRKLMKIGGKD